MKNKSLTIAMLGLAVVGFVGAVVSHSSSPLLGEVSDPYYANLYDVEDLANKWGVMAERLQYIKVKEPHLLEDKAVDSVGGFNPFTVEFDSYEALERAEHLTAEQKYKWLRYRREEIGVCFEDEELDEFGQYIWVEGE